MPRSFGSIVVGAALLALAGVPSSVDAQSGPPGAPSSFSASVSGSSVTLTWSAPVTGGAPTGYSLDAGSAAGSSNVGTFPVGNVTSVTVTAPNGTYFVRVRATNASGSSGPSNEVTVVVGSVVPPPGVPQSLQVAVNGSLVTLTWQPPVSGGAPTGYVIDAGTAAGSSNIGSIPAGASTSYSVNAPPGTYFARVRATNASGSSAASNEVTIVVGGAAAPGAPQILQFTVSGANVTLTWGAPSSGGPPSGYLIDAGSSAGGSNLGTFPQPNVTSVTVSAPTGTYYVRVRAQNAAGAGPASNEVVIVVGGTPVSIDGTWNGTSSQGLEFSFIVSNSRVTTTLAGARFGGCSTVSQTSGLSQPVSPGSFTFSVPTSPGSIGFTVTGSFAGTTNASGSATITATPGAGGCSGTISVTWSAANAGPGKPFKPGEPSGLSASVAAGGSVTLNWSAPFTGGAPSGYSIEIGTAPGASNAGTFSSPITSFNTTVPPGTYYARVKAVNDSGTGAASSEAQFTVVDAPGVPANVVAQVSGLSVTFTWSAPVAGGTPTGYAVEIGTSPGASDTHTATSVAATYTTTLSPGAYYARVKSTNAAGSSAASNEATFTIVSLNGTWNGDTSQGQPIGFIISNGSVTSMLVGVDLSSCTSAKQQSFPTASLTGANLSINSGGAGPNFSHNITGTLTGTTASGSASFTGVGGGCSGSVSVTWTATNAGFGAPYKPGQPSNLAASPSGTAVSFTWNASGLGGTPTGYSIEIGTSPGASNTGTFATAIASYQTTLAPGTYYARVKATNASGTSRASTEVSFTIVP